MRLSLLGMAAVVMLRAQPAVPPSISSLQPPSVTAGAAAFTLTVTGARYAPQSQVIWKAGAPDQVPLTTAYVSETRLDAAVPPELVAAAGTVQVAVTQGGVSSGSFDFFIFPAVGIRAACPLPNAIAGRPYTYQLGLVGGAPPYTWSIAGGALPPGLSLASTGLISGNALSTAQATFTLRLADAQQNVATQACSMKSIAGAAGQSLFITALEPPSVLAGSNGLQLTIRGLGMQSGVSVVWNAGGVPETPLANSIVDPSQLVATVPTPLLVAPGSFPIALRRSVLTRVETSNVEPLTVVSPVRINTSCPLPDATQNARYEQPLAAANGFPPYSWSLASGELPPGVAIQPSGSVSGTPSAAGTFSFTMQVTDSQRTAATASCSVRVLGPLSVSPAALTFVMDAGGPPPGPQWLSVSAGVDVAVGARITTQTGGSWLNGRSSLQSALGADLSGRSPGLLEIRISDTPPASPGIYQAQLQLTADQTSNRIVNVPVTLTVNPARPLTVSAAPSSIAVGTPRDYRQLVQRLAVLLATQTTPLPYTVASSAPWVAASVSSGVLRGTEPVWITLNPAGLDPGVYRAVITVNAAGQPPLTIPIVLTVSFSPDLLSMTPTGFTIRLPQGATSPQPSRIYLGSQAGSAIAWDSSASTISGGDWLTVQPGSDAAGLDGPAAASVTASAGTLDPGLYFGEVKVAGSGIENSPRLANAVLEVLPANAAMLDLSPGGLVFNGGGTQSVAVRNLSAATARIEFAVSGDASAFTVNSSARNVAAGQTVQIDVTPTPQRAGVYRASLNVKLSSDSQARSVELVLVNRPQGCVAQTVVPVVTSHAAPFSIGSGLPLGLEVKLVDDCGVPVTVGSVALAPFGISGAPFTLTHTRQGLWSGTWTAPAATGAVRLNFTWSPAPGAVRPPGILATSFSGVVTPTQGVPILNQIVSGAGFQPGFPLSLGALFAASGSSLADARVAAQPPLPPQIGQTRLLVAGQPVPLIFAGPTSAASSQVNGVLPFELRVNLVQQVAAQNGTRRSQYLEVPIALAQPSIFAVAPGVSTQALAIDATGPGLIADTANPALRGGSLVIYAEGLGPVNQALPPGAPAPADPPARPVAPVSVTIGGQAAAVENAQLMPGSAGVYQIRVTVPDGVDAGDAVPVVITAGGLSSAVLTIAVR